MGLVGGLGIATGFLILSFYSVTTVSAIVARGIAGGIEEASKMLMPVLVTLLAGLAVYSAIEGDLVGALRFLFVFDAARMTPQGALEALGLRFFSIGVGLCIMITYAAYAGTHVDLGEVAVVTIVSDTAISFMAGFAIFPLVFAKSEFVRRAGPRLHDVDHCLCPHAVRNDRRSRLFRASAGGRARFRHIVPRARRRTAAK